MQRALAQLNHMPRRLIPLALILVLVFSIIGPGVAQADPGWYNANWDYRKKITLESDYISGSANLTSFPVLISIVDTDLASDALDNGYDILFTAGDEVTKLQHDIESFNGTSGNLTAWVMLPSLSPSVDTDIYMYYGNAGSGNSENATGAWDSNYRMVQHLEETSGTHYDSTQYSNDGTENIDAPGTQDADGKIDGADDVDGTDDYIDIDTVVNDMSSAGTGTIEAWIYSEEPNNTTASIVAFGDTDADSFIYLAIADGNLYAYSMITSASQWGLDTDSAIADYQQWLHIALVQDGTSPILYVNGTAPAQTFISQVDKTAWFDDISGIDNARIASRNKNSGGNTDFFDGKIDEVRISNTNRSADWIATSYNNQNSPSTFITLGPEIGTPSVTTNTASSVEETSALLRGTLDDDGGEASEYRFQYGTSSGIYTYSTAWTGSINSGASFNATISSLNKGDVYYFIAEARNNAGTGSGSEQNFLTKPLEPTSFSATTASSSQINLSWTKGTGADKTMVRGKEGSYPTSRTDGYQVYFDTGTSASDTSLNPSTTYYYRAWSEVTGSQQWSDNYASANAATTSGAPTVIGGLVLPINKATVLAPWLILSLILSLVITRIILNFRKGRSSSYS